MNVTAVDYAARIAAGKCPRCGCYLSTGWMRRNCAKCLREIAELSRKHYHRKRGNIPPAKREPAPARDPKFYRDRYQARKAAGQCPRCGEKLSPGTVYTLCTGCRGEAEEKREENRARCRCGLLLPCHNCVSSIYAFASIRRSTD